MSGPVTNLRRALCATGLYVTASGEAHFRVFPAPRTPRPWRATECTPPTLQDLAGFELPRHPARGDVADPNLHPTATDIANALRSGATPVLSHVAPLCSLCSSSSPPSALSPRSGPPSLTQPVPGERPPGRSSHAPDAAGSLASCPRAERAALAARASWSDGSEQ